MLSAQEMWKRFGSAAFKPVDIASIVFFRIAFGALMIWRVGDHLYWDDIATLWLKPKFHFSFYGFAWVHPWPATWLYAHWIVLGVSAFFVAIGFCYRPSAIVLCLSNTYFFLLDEAYFVNHTYLLCLLSFLFCIVPAHRAFSIDAWLRPRLRAQTVPAWNLWLLRLQMGVVYFYGGVAKLSPDWLQGEPMRLYLSQHPDFPLIGRFFHDEAMVYMASYTSLLLDLLIVPLLLWRRTRSVAFSLAVLFHVMNSRLFTIGIFPWLAIAATALFFSPSWPRQLLGRLGLKTNSGGPATESPARAGWTQRTALAFVVIYSAIQILVPLRHFLSRGGIEWTFGVHRFSWRMYVQAQSVQSMFYVTDPISGGEARIAPRQVLNARQASIMADTPDIAWQFAHYLATGVPRRGTGPLIVQARVLTMINGRPPEPYLDPAVNLAAEPRPFLFRPRWIKAINDPLPPLEERYRRDTFP